MGEWGRIGGGWRWVGGARGVQNKSVISQQLLFKFEPHEISNKLTF